MKQVRYTTPRERDNLFNKSQSTATVQQFLDLEAQVDDEIEDEEIEDDLEGMN